MFGRNGFLALLVAAAVALGLALWLQSGGGGGDDVADRVGEPLLPGFAERVNELRRVEVILPGNRTLVSLTRGESGWQVAERDGYRADWDQLRGVLRALAQAEVVAPKTARAEYYDELGVTDVDSPDAAGVELRLGEQPVISVIVGKSASQGRGRYVRLRGELRSYLIDQELELPTEIGGWLDSDIVDIQSSQITGVTVRHADGEVVRLGRADGDTLSLLNRPEGREISGQWALNALANALIGLRAQDVRRAQDDVPDRATRVLFTTKDGVNVVVSLFSAAADNGDEYAEPKYWARFDVSREPGTDDATAGTVDAEGTDGGNQVAAGQGDKQSAGAGQAAAETQPGEGGQAAGDEQSVAGAGEAIDVEALRERLSGWEFELRASKYNAMSKRLEDLLKPLETDVEAENAAPDS